MLFEEPLHRSFMAFRGVELEHLKNRNSRFRSARSGGRYLKHETETIYTS